MAVEVLLRACPDSISEIDYKSATALHMAASKGAGDTCILLLKHAAEWDYRSACIGH